MAQEPVPESIEPPPAITDPSLSRNTSFSRLNAAAAEFVPRSPNHRTDASPRLLMPPQPHSPVFHAPYGGGSAAFVKQQQEVQPPEQPDHHVHAPQQTKNGDEGRHKVLNQVEYYFSDVNLATTDHLMRFISKDPDGFVPISVVASFKKIKALVSNHHQLATILRKSSKLVVSDDGKKVRRQHLLKESDMEDLQSRIVIAENLPEDHSYQNLMRVFSAVGCVKTIRTCQPQILNGGASAASRSKVENMLFSNKLHAFVEYENIEIAERAVTELNDERNWRSGLRVRQLLKRTSKSEQARGRKLGHEGEGNAEEDDLSTSEQLNDRHLDDHSQSTDLTSHGNIVEDSIHEKEGDGRRGRGRGRGKVGRGRGGGGHHHHHNSHRGGSHIIGTPTASNKEQSTAATKQPPGPRMPDGTRGFTIGRGKPMVSQSQIA